MSTGARSTPNCSRQKLDEAKGVVKTQMQGAIVISTKDLDKRRAALGGVPWTPFSDWERQTPWTAELAKWLQREGVVCRVAPVAAHTDADRLKARHESVKTWYEKDWMKLDPKLRTSCVEGISSFLSLFDMEDVADIFCPKAPAKERAAEGEEAGNGDSRPPVGKAQNAAAPSTPGRADRERESPRAQHARRIESGAGPRHRRLPQKRLAPDPAPAAGTDETGA